MMKKIFQQLENGKDSSQRTRLGFVSKKRIIKFLVLFVVFGFGFWTISLYMTRYSDFRPVLSLMLCSDDVQNELGIGHWIRPLKNLMHNMSDEELFWRASFDPQVKKFPFKRVPKVAFMFLSRGPLPLYPLWDKFFEGHEGLYSIYAHSLPEYKPLFPQKSLFFGRQIPSQVAEWGKMSMCDAERRLLANALLDIENERFVLLSESCIPLYNFSTIYQYLINSNHSFVGSFDDRGPFGRGRYNYRMMPEVNISQWRKGAQWFEVNRKLALSLVADTKYYPKFEKFCRPACYVDEHYFPTMLTIESPNLIANRSVTWVDWSRGGSHPATFGKNDITEAFLKRILESEKCSYNNQPSSVCSLFARKFAPSTLESLLQHAHILLGSN